MARTKKSALPTLPPELERVREAARRAIGEVEPAGPPKGSEESHGLMLSTRTNGGRDLPPYYLVYFLLVDLLGFDNLGQWEKVAWTVPIRYQGRLYSIEHRKLGLGIFAPTLDAAARVGAKPSEVAEADAKAIAELVRKAVRKAEPYFEWRAEQAARGAQVNVLNKCDWLFDRYLYFRDRFKSLSAEAEQRKDERIVKKKTLPDGSVLTSGSFPSYTLKKEAEWNAQAAIDAFFSWTEHSFIHLAILQGKLRTGEEVARLAEADWKEKFKAALDVSDAKIKEHYDRLLDLRAQIRNFMAHGAFGKRGEAFRFHSGAGAVPVFLTHRQKHRYALTDAPAFDESWAIAEIESFIEHLWSEPRSAMRPHVFSELPSILTYAADGTYARAINSEEDMKEFVEHLTGEFDRAANMDW